MIAYIIPTFSLILALLNLLVVEFANAATFDSSFRLDHVSKTPAKNRREVR